MIQGKAPEQIAELPRSSGAQPDGQRLHDASPDEQAAAEPQGADASAQRSAAQPAGGRSRTLGRSMPASGDARYDYLVSNFHVAFPSGRWGNGRGRRSRWRRWLADPLGGLLGRGGGVGSGELRALVEAQLAQAEAIREGNERLNQKVDRLCDAVDRLASNGITAAAGPAAMPVMRSNRQRKLSEEHNAVLKEIFDHNVELRQQIAAQSASSASQDNPHSADQHNGDQHNGTEQTQSSAA